MRFHLKFWRQSDQIHDLWYLLGFQEPFEIDQLGDDLYQSVYRTNALDLGANPYIVNSLADPESSTYTNFRPYRLPWTVSDNVIYLCFIGLGSIIEPNHQDVVAKVILDQPFGGVCKKFVSNPVIFRDTPLDKLDRLHVKWIDSSGNSINFNGIDHSFTIEIVEYVQQLENTEYSSRRGKIDKSSYSSMVKYHAQ